MLGSVMFFNPILGFFAQLLEEEFGWRRSEVALAISVGGLTAAAAAPFMGHAIDRWGGRWVISGGALGMAICALILSQMQELWHLLVFFAIGRAFAMAAIEPASFVAVSNWFIRKRALVAGFVGIGSRLGFGLMPLVLAVVVDWSGDWRTGWYAVAVIAILSGIPAVIFMRRRPEDVGLLPDGDPTPSDWDTLPSAPAERAFTLRQAVRTRAYWLVGLSLSCVMFAGGAINFHQIPHMIDQGLTRTEAASVVLVFSAMAVVGALSGGAIATRITMRRTMAPALMGMAGGVLLLMNVSSIPTALLFATFYGGVFGVQVALQQVVYAEYFGRRSMGVIRGSMQPVGLMANAGGPFLVGLWYDRTGAYTGAFWLIAVLFVIASIAITLASYPKQPDTPEDQRQRV